jgi:hypothetical protein
VVLSCSQSEQSEAMLVTYAVFRRSRKVVISRDISGCSERGRWCRGLRVCVYLWMQTAVYRCL